MDLARANRGLELQLERKGGGVQPGRGSAMYMFPDLFHNLSIGLLILGFLVGGFDFHGQVHRVLSEAHPLLYFLQLGTLTWEDTVRRRVGNPIRFRRLARSQVFLLLAR
jgi:hypothetical protein